MVQAVVTCRVRMLNGEDADGEGVPDGYPVLGDQRSPVPSHPTNLYLFIQHKLNNGYTPATVLGTGDRMLNKAKSLLGLKFKWQKG